MIISTLRFCLLKCIEDCNRVSGRRTFADPSKNICEAFFEEELRFLLSIMPDRIGYKLVSLGGEHRPKKAWICVLEGSAQPYVEVIRKVRVSYIVIIWRIGRY